MSMSNRLDRIHVCRHAIDVDRDNCFCPWRDRSFKPRGAHRSTRRVDIYKNRFRADVANCPGSCYESQPNRNHFVSGPDVETAQGKMERARATVQAHTMIDPAVGCKFRLEI